MLLTTVATLDELLHTHRAALGPDFTAYRNHTYRVVNLCVAQSSGDPEQLEKMAIAAAFHDMGIWTHGTFDYLQPSVRLANAHLSQAFGVLLARHPEQSPISCLAAIIAALRAPAEECR